MNAHDAIRNTYDLSRTVLTSYISDLEDNELLQRPGDGCNHIAWQLGHLIASEANLLEQAVPGSAPALPDGFAENHGKEQAGSDDGSRFCSKAEYLELMNEMREAAFRALDSLTAEDLDKPGPEAMRSFCPTLGSFFTLIAAHGLMHAGQFVPVRRRLEKPVLI